MSVLVGWDPETRAEREGFRTAFRAVVDNAGGSVEVPPSCHVHDQDSFQRLMRLLRPMIPLATGADLRVVVGSARVDLVPR